MKERFAKLICVKSIITIATTIVFCVLAGMGEIDSSQFLTIFTTIIAFYFGTQSAKNDVQ